MQNLILVAGATGGVGRHVVTQLVSEGMRVRALVRDRSNGHSLGMTGVDTALGDTRHPETLAQALKQVQAVICTTGSHAPIGANRPEEVDYEGVRNLAQTCVEAGVERLVLVSSLAVTRPDHPLNAFGQVLSWKLRGEEAVRASGLRYTIVRPGGLTDTRSRQNALVFAQGDQIVGRIARAEVARVCVQALAHAESEGKTFEVIEAEGAPPTDWAEMFRVLEPDFKGIGV